MLSPFFRHDLPCPCDLSFAARCRLLQHRRVFSLPHARVAIAATNANHRMQKIRRPYKRAESWSAFRKTKTSADCYLRRDLTWRSISIVSELCLIVCYFTFIASVVVNSKSSDGFWDYRWQYCTTQLVISHVINSTQESFQVTRTLFWMQPENALS